jgi:hypothetical protein
MIPVNLPYEVSLRDTQGNPLAGELNPPIVVKLPYSDTELTASGVSAQDLQPLYYDESSASWETVENYVIDETAAEVVIFANRTGSYTLVATHSAENQYSIYLPVIMR